MAGYRTEPDTYFTDDVSPRMTNRRPNPSQGRNRDRRGTATAEMAVVLPLLVLITFGIAELGWYLHLAQVVHNAARQGARAAVRAENSNPEVVSAVQTTLSNDVGLASSAVTVQITRLTAAGDEMYQVQSLDENEDGEPVRVTVTVQYNRLGTLTNMLGLQGGSLSSSAVMQRQQ